MASFCARGGSLTVGVDVPVALSSPSSEVELTSGRSADSFWRSGVRSDAPCEWEGDIFGERQQNGFRPILEQQEENDVDDATCLHENIDSRPMFTESAYKHDDPPTIPLWC